MSKRSSVNLSGVNKVLKVGGRSDVLDVTRSPYFPEPVASLAGNTLCKNDEKTRDPQEQKEDSEAKISWKDSDSVHTATIPGTSRDLTSIKGAAPISENYVPRPKLSHDFYDQDSITLAKALLGKF